ncbi:hypothetical protein [Variovorax sp. UC74_104]|uniref:hypothetical protein n=1 Tax=Variovorax sp. UC74_104 TaxID=3374555 RepID=UPI003757CAD2
MASRDPAAQPINFQLNLPTTWNGKAVQYGGRGLQWGADHRAGSSAGRGAGRCSPDCAGLCDLRPRLRPSGLGVPRRRARRFRAE